MHPSINSICGFVESEPRIEDSIKTYLVSLAGCQSQFVCSASVVCIFSLLIIIPYIKGRWIHASWSIGAL
jgi:hypothetical protein